MNRNGGAVLAMIAMLVVACAGNPPTTTPATSPTSAGPPSPEPAGEGARGHAGASCWSAGVEQVAAGPVEWEDRTGAWGLLDPLVGMRGHAAAWGDVDDDGWPDLVVGTFADRPVEDYALRGAAGPAPDRLLLGGPEGFTVAAGFPGDMARTSGAVLADLDADGDDDLVLARNVRPRSERPANRFGTTVYRNDGRGGFEPAAQVGPESGARSVGVLDFDGDRLLDLLVVTDRFVGEGSALLRNTGGLSFDDVTGELGFPEGVLGLGVAVADLNGDLLTDLFVAGSNRMFVNEGGRFREVVDETFRWEAFGEEDDVAGAAVGDVDRDGQPDLVLGQHYNSTLEDGRRVPVRLYLNDGADGGTPRFRDVTEAAGLPAFPTKAPNVEVADLDNDGWPDIVTSASAAGGSHPAVLHNEGLSDGVPNFSVPEGLGSPQYWISGATADVDRDGRLDLFLAEWEPSLPSLALRNAGPSGHWLEVASAGPNRGIGSVVEVYRAGEIGRPEALLGRGEIGVTVGFGAGGLPVVHLGLGQITEVDIRVVNGSEEPVELRSVPADRRLVVGGDC